MNRTSPRHQSFSLMYSFVVADGLADLKCRACKSYIDTHQPNPIQPERILGTCPQCGVWYLIEALGEGEKMMVLQLPDVSEVPHPALPVPQAH